MKIAFPTEGHRKLKDKVAMTFSRAPTFTIVTVEGRKTQDSIVIKNQAGSLGQGAGPLAASALRDNGVTVLITSDVGPGASTILNTMGIKVYSAEAGKKVKNVLVDWIDQMNYTEECEKD